MNNAFAIFSSETINTAQILSGLKSIGWSFFWIGAAIRKCDSGLRDSNEIRLFLEMTEMFKFADPEKMAF